jgi:hypothetical protein
MNERIIELADKAVEDISSGPWNISDEFCEKFARLIVRDLIDSMIKRYGDDDELPIQEIKLFVKEHFGVEQ